MWPLYVHLLHILNQIHRLMNGFFLGRRTEETEQLDDLTETRSLSCLSNSGLNLIKKHS